MALFIDNWMRVFDIPETSKHLKGFTLYKIVSIVYPKNCPDAVTKVTVWKRFNDFKKLHRDLKVRHKSMQIEDKYPHLSNSSYFKRFDSEVINQRKNSILAFLEYIAVHPSLFKSIEFVKFFETSHTPQESLNSNINIIRAQLNLPDDPEIIYPNNSDDEQGHSDSDSISTYSITSSLITQTDETSNLDRRSLSSHINVNQIQQQNVASKGTSLDSVSEKSYRNCYPTPPSTPEFIIVSDNESTQYITNAAESITKATQFEYDKNFSEAFTAYKNGISSLLEGVKGDEDTHRRQVVRYKIEKYLLRAEKIYNLHLSPEMTHLKNICKNEHSLVSSYNSIRRPIEDLFNYKVLKIIDNGMVVLHKKEHNVFYLKVIPKSSQIFDCLHLNIPKDVPYMIKLFQYYDSSSSIFIVTQYVSGGKLFDYIKQKSSTAHNETLTNYSSITFEKDVSELMDADLDGACSDSSDYSYSDLITDYTSKKKVDTSENKIETDKNEHSEPSSNSCTNVNYEISSQDNKNSDSLSQNNSNIDRSFQRTASEISYTKEFTSVNYIPPIEDIKKWFSQLLLAIEKLHKAGVVIFDLNPKNLLLDERGNLLLTFVCNFRDKSKLLCQKFENNDYCAPEVFSLQTVTFAADWWSFGAILFEVLTGMCLRSVHAEGIYNYTLLKIPKYVCPEGKSLLKRLLVYEPHERLGCGINGIEDLKTHPFFNKIDWIKLKVEAFKTL